MLTWELPSASVMTSSWAGDVTAELMLMSLMMKSGLYHQPACMHHIMSVMSALQAAAVSLMKLPQVAAVKHTHDENRTLLKRYSSTPLIHTASLCLGMTHHKGL